jgi:hypothetical protein
VPPYRYESVESEVYVEHGGVKIYRTYADDDIDAPRSYWFTPDPEDPSSEFDVRTLMTSLQLPSSEPSDPETDDGRRAIIRTAIDRSMLG